MIGSVAGNSLRLEVLGYQFPDLPTTAHGTDLNWLVISGEASQDGRTWSFRDPCLLTGELSELIAWLERLGGGHRPDRLAFLEPNLTFEAPAPGIVRVLFSHEAAPPWAPSRFDSCGLDCRTSSEQALKAADSLRGDLRRWPQRPSV